MEMEDAFNLAIRRMLRSSATHHVLHVAFSAFGFIRANRELLKLLHNTTVDVVQPIGGSVYQMPQGDQFVVLGEGAASRVGDIVANITAAAFPDRSITDDEDQALVKVFVLPRDYAAMREVANACLAAQPATTAAEAKPGKTGQTDGDVLEGPLTAWALSKLEVVVGETDLSGYLRSQMIFETDHRGQWRPLFEEYYTSITDLHRDKFPKIVLHPDYRLFLELCRLLDRRRVPEVLRRHRSKPGHRRSFNLSLATYHGPFFEKFIRESVDVERQTLILEINRADLLQEPRAATKALAVMREAGFGTALDGITLDLLPLTNLHRVGVDFIKISLAPNLMGMLKDDACVSALKKFPKEKIVFCRCEKNSSVTIGQAFGITRFQGWAIDILAAAKHEDA